MIDQRLYEHPLVIFLPYNEILKDPNVFILHLILDIPNLKNQFKEYLNLDLFDCQTEERIQTLLLNRDKRNILEWLAIKEFDFEFNYEKLYSKYKEIYLYCKQLKMYETIKDMFNQDFVKDIYIYSKIKDERIIYDLYSVFGVNEKIHYVTGPYIDTITDIGEIDLIVDNDIDRMTPILYDKNYYDKTFLIARYGYNYEIKDKRIVLKNDLEKHSSKYGINLVEFFPFSIERNMIANG